MSLRFPCLVETRYNLHFTEEATGSERLSDSLGPHSWLLPKLRLEPRSLGFCALCHIFKCFHRSLLCTEGSRAPGAPEKELEMTYPSVKFLETLLFSLKNSGTLSTLFQVLHCRFPIKMT